MTQNSVQGVSESICIRVSSGDEVFSERFVRYPTSIVIGQGDDLLVPDSAEFLLRGRWDTRDRLQLEDGSGATYSLGSGQSLNLSVRELRVSVSLVSRFSLKRSEPLWNRASLPWLVMVGLMTLFSQQAGWAYENQCAWRPLIHPSLTCPPEQSAHGVGGGLTAEYLARLLREDYAGVENGVLQREERDRSSRREKRVFLPAGNKGPITHMGGAAETAPEPVRAPSTDRQKSIAAKRSKPDEGPRLAVEKSAAPPERRPPPEELNTDVSDKAQQLEDSEEVEVPAEEKEGWGISDWYDMNDAAMDKLEIDTIVKATKERLKINPKDLEALEVLSYYLYLSQDYEEAGRTYDTYIRLYPESAAGYNNKALVLKRQKKYVKEEQLYRVALALAPDDPFALNNLGINLAHQGRFDEALAIMAHLQEIDPDEPYSDLHRAKIYAEMGDVTQALFYLEKALAGMAKLDTLHNIEFRQDIRLDPSFDAIRESLAFHDLLVRYYGHDIQADDGL